MPLSLDALRQELNVPCLAAGRSDLSGSKFEVAGVRKCGSDILAEPTDVFLLGSLSKAMTATLIAILTKDGLFEWDSTLGEIIFPMLPNMHPDHKNTILKMLASHYSGISIRWELQWSLLRRLWEPATTPEEGRWLGLEKALTEAPKHKPGTSFAYDNTNYYILAAVVERLHKRPWEEVIQERLFKPLGMQTAGFGIAPESSNDSIDNPWPHLRALLPFTRPIPTGWLSLRYRDWPLAGAPAGSIHVTMQDYNKFLRLHVDGGNGTMALGLTVEDFKLLHTPFQADADGEARYTPGGWIRPKEHDRTTAYSLYHRGANPFNLTQAWLDIGDGRGDAYMSMTNVGLQLRPTPPERTVRALREGNLVLG